MTWFDDFAANYVRASNKRKTYPGTKEAERERSRQHRIEDEEPDFIAGAPNYDKFPNMTPAEVLAWLNID